MNRLPRAAARALVASMVALVALGPASPAAAHDPIFLTEEQTTPDAGPYLPDGAISWAIYGTFPGAGETRGFEFDLREGDDLYISLLIPNLEPELSLPDDQLPYVELTMPDGEVRSLEAEIREIFDEEFSQTSYVTLVEQKEPAIAGRHAVVVHSQAPARFTVAVGEREEFFTPADRTVDRPSSFLEISEPLNAWYQTPPGEAAADTAEGEEAVEVDVEAMETELERLADEADSGDAEAETEAEAETDAGDDAGSTAAADADAEAADEAAPPVAEGSDDDGSDLGWVVPVAIVVVVVLGGGVWLTRRRAAT